MVRAAEGPSNPAGAGRHAPSTRLPWARPLRALPIPVRPRHTETVLSYLRRLADAHALPPAALVRLLGRPDRPSCRHWRPRDDVILSHPAQHRLAELSGQHRDRLARALPALRVPAAAGDRYDVRLHWSPTRWYDAGDCPRCRLRRDGAYLAAWSLPPAVYCSTHELWLGGSAVHRAPLPELPRAQARLAALWRRHGSHRAAHALELAVTIITEWRTRPNHTLPMAERWAARREVLRHHGSRAERQHDGAAASSFPELVVVATLIADRDDDTNSAHRLGELITRSVGFDVAAPWLHRPVLAWLSHPWHGLDSQPPSAGSTPVDRCSH